MINKTVSEELVRSKPPEPDLSENRYENSFPPHAKRPAPCGTDLLKTLDFGGFLLPEVPLQQAFERPAVTGLVAGHLVSRCALLHDWGATDMLWLGIIWPIWLSEFIHGLFQQSLLSDQKTEGAIGKWQNRMRPVFIS